MLSYNDLGWEAPMSLNGTLRDGRIVLRDRRDSFLLEGALKGGKLETRLSIGSTGRPNSVPATSTRP